MFTIRRWLRDGLLPGEQTTPAAPWRIRLTDEVRARFVPDVPDGFVSLADAAQRARLRPPDRVAQGPTRRTARHPRHPGRRKGLASRFPPPAWTD